MKIALYGRPFAEDCRNHISELFRLLEENKIELFVYRPFLDFIKNQAKITAKIAGTFESHEDLKKDVGFMFSVGGDGTFLKTVAIVQDYGIPIAGINTGRLGFLANITVDSLSSAIRAIMQGQFSTEHRSLIRIELSNGTLSGFCCALNDVTVQKRYSSMITIHAYLNDVLLNSYWADGLIISTPTGSTAYSLSVGGPIATPDSNNFIVSPLASHNLTVRPVIVPDSKVIRLKTENRDSSFLISVDSRVEIIDSNPEIIIRKADFDIKTIRIEGNTFYDTLRHKLMWGLDRRN
jgi:NAD+ kinase